MADFSNRVAEPWDANENPDVVWLDGFKGDAITVPTFVFGRLTGIGQTYGLHYLSALVYDDQNHLNPTQCEGLLDEIDFVLALVNDPVLESNVGGVRAAVVSCIRSSPPCDLVIELES